jgi:predicted metal-dependent hydrolase
MPPEPVPWPIRHPLANRCIEYQNLQIHYCLRRTRRRTIGLQVGPEGLLVSAPRWALVSDIVAAVQERAAWALAKMRQVQQAEQARVQRRIQWRDGDCVSFLGQPLVLRLGFTDRSGLVLRDEDLNNRVLEIPLGVQASPSQVQDLVCTWLIERARPYFESRLRHFAPQLGVQWSRLRLSRARTRWGSASADGRICLNWRLMHHSAEVIDYVVVHELSHLRVMNHSPQFWSTVASILPGYAALRLELKNTLLPGA